MTASERAVMKEKLQTGTRFAHYPGLRRLELMVPGLEIAGGAAELTVLVKAAGADGNSARDAFSFDGSSATRLLDLPVLADGSYEILLSLDGDAPFDVGRFEHKNFVWLGNDLGKSDTVYPPFTPLRIEGVDLDMVLRRYRMNGFGLWDSVLSQGKELLGGPAVLRLTTEEGEAAWTFSEGEWDSKAAHKAVYRASAATPQVSVNVVSSIEYDGAMKVEMELLPGKEGGSIDRLWLDIPALDGETPLLHYCMAPGIRRNYSGSMPRGGRITWTTDPEDTDPPRYGVGGAPFWIAEPGDEDGVVWTNRDIRPMRHVWKTDFVPYIWFGGAERGIAWFGNSPRGYRVDSQGVMQRFRREGGLLHLEVDLVNKPGQLQEGRRIVFGMQASPTRPMPEGWRSNVAIPGIDIGVHCAPYGGLICPDKYPDDFDYRTAEEIIKVRQTGVLDESVFEKLDSQRSPHFKYRTSNRGATWLEAVLMDAKANQAFALEADTLAKGFVRGALQVPLRYHVDGEKHGFNPIWDQVPEEPLYPERIARKIKDAPLAKYFEEHASNIVNEEWIVYQDEWRGNRTTACSEYEDILKERLAGRDYGQRSEPVAEPVEIGNNFEHGSQNLPDSYRDFALWHVNEWMKRGVSTYIDNIYPKVVDNPLTSQAYIDDEGDMQPAAWLWEMRELHKRIWVLSREWDLKKPPYPLLVVHHMTNTVMLPIHTWNDSMLDLELSVRREPLPAEYMAAQAAGRQTGSYRHLLHPVQPIRRDKWFTPDIKDINTDIVRMEWGMRMVHEALRWLFPYENFAVFEPARTFEKALWEFGYGLDECRVANYWDDEPPVKMSDPGTKWLLLWKPADRSAMLVLQSYGKEDTPVEVILDTAGLGFAPEPAAVDLETGTVVAAEGLPGGLRLQTVLEGYYGTRVIMVGR